MDDTNLDTIIQASRDDGALEVLNNYEYNLEMVHSYILTQNAKITEQLTAILMYCAFADEVDKALTNVLKALNNNNAALNQLSKQVKLDIANIESDYVEQKH